MICIYSPAATRPNAQGMGWTCLALVLFSLFLSVGTAKAELPLPPGGDAAARCEAAAWATPPDIFLRPGSGKRVDLVYRGLRNLLPTRLLIPDPASVESVFVEVVYKGKLPSTSLHKAIQAKLSTGKLITLQPQLIKGNWGADGVAVFSAQVEATAHVQLDFEVEEASAQSMLLYVLRHDPGSQTFQAGVYASVFGYADTKSFSIPVPRDTRTRDITVTIPITEITTDGRVLDFLIKAGGRQTAFRRQWNTGYNFGNECCIDSVQATLRGVTGDFDKIDISIISPPSSARPSGQSYVLSGILQATVSPTCAPLKVTPPTDICTDNTVVFNSLSPGKGYTASWDFGEGAHPRTATGFGDIFLMFDREGPQRVTVRVTGPDCVSDQVYTLNVKQCGISKCALQKATVIQHPANGNNDGVIELDPCVSCGSTAPYTVFYTFAGKTFDIGPLNQAHPRITGLKAGTYEKLYFIDANGCQTNVTGPITLCNGGCGNTGTCPEQICTLTGFNESGRKRAFWLPGLGLGDVRWRWEEGTGEFVVTGPKSAEIRGRIVNMASPDCGFVVKMLLRNRRNWSEWSALGRDWKGSRTRLSSNQHLDWDYYEMEPTGSTFQGFGCYAGTLALSPRPADYKYGVQVGEGANDQNLSPGISAWFGYTGKLNGNTISGEGDINAEGTCRFQDMTRNAVPILSCAADFTVACGGNPDDAPRPTINCGNAGAYKLSKVDREIGGKPRKIERTWTVTGPGGPATCRQILTYGDDGPPVFTKVPSSGEMSCEAVQAQTAEATDGCGKVTIELRESKYNETCPGTYDLRRVWTATDESGNTTTAEVIVHVVDRTGPIFIAPPADMVIECKDPLPTDNPNTSDACGGKIAIAYEVTPCQAALPIYSWQDGQLVYLTEAVDPNLSYKAGMQALTLTSSCSDQPDVRKRWRVNNPNAYPVFVRRVEAYGRSVYKGFVIPANAEVYFFTINESGANTTKIYWANQAGQEQQASKAAGNDRCASLSAAETCTCVITRRWTAKDACGNTSVSEQKIWQRDTKAPTIRNLPADVNVSSAAAVPAAGDVTATDGCTKATVSMQETRVQSGAYNCNGAAIYFLIGSSGASLPLLELNGGSYRLGEQPLQLQERCGGVATLTGTVVDVRNPEARFELSLSLKTRRTYAEHSAAGGAAPDKCAQADKSKWLFYQIDGNTSRITGAGANAGITLAVTPAASTWLQLGPGANNSNCKLGIFGDFSYRTTAGAFSGTTGTLRTAYVAASLEQSGDCAAGFTIIRVYTATDECGNRAIERQVIRVADRTPPTLVGIPSNTTISCAASLPTATVTATDDSGTPADVKLAEVKTGDDCRRTITRTWTATDACGNSSTGQQIITQVDNKAPTITFSDPLLQGRSSGDLVVVSCSAIPTFNEATATVKDDCDPAPKVTFVDQRLETGDCATKGFSERFKCTWTATDRCGNQTVVVIYIEFHDSEKPVFTNVPPALSLTCEAPLPTSSPTATDNCTQRPVIKETQRRVAGSCTNSYQIVRTWTATDACGNSSTVSQVVTYTDLKAPTFSKVPAAIAISCADAVPTSQPVVADACDQEVRIVETSTKQSINCGNGYTLVRLWTATDNCGNSATASQLVTVTDKLAPTLTLTHPLLKDFRDGQELVVDCGQLPTFGKGDAVASDACDRAPTITYTQSETATGNCGTDGFVSRITATWIATDGCGNSTRTTVTLKVRDTSKPSISSIPSAITIACDQPLPKSQPVIADGCTPSDKLRVEETSERLAGACADGYQVLRRWRVTDACGNLAEASQIITVEDKTRPTLSGIPESITLSCEEQLPSKLPTATDNCDKDVSVSFKDSKTAGNCAAGYSLVRVFTATDNCGNTATASQVITIRDSKAPAFANVPAAVTLSCSDKLPTTQPTASDNCDSKPTIAETSSRKAGSCPDSYEVVRTWTATDACGNKARASQVVTIRDTKAPVLSALPQNLSVSCDAAIPDTKPKATDDCDTEVNVAVTQTTRPGSCANAYELVRLFTATDNCGNSTTASQVVTVIDKAGPVFSSVPVNVTIGCNGVVPKDQPSATDNCDGQVAVTEKQERQPGTCPGAYQLIRVFSASDKCGNLSTVSQTVTVTDAVAPMFAYVPADVAQSCATAMPTELPQVTDDCDKAVKVTETQERRAQKCAGTYELVRMFTATDHCGNRSTASQVVKIFDDKAPVFAAVPADVTIWCHEPVPTTAPTVSDNCDTKPTVALKENREPGNCTDGYRVIRIWTATDGCGNVATARQVVTVKDIEAPVFAGVPAALTLSCSQALPTTKPTASDKCDQDVAIAETQRREPGTCADGYRLVRIWTATDNCGNTATATQLVTVEDREAPVFAGVPATITINCNTPLPSVGPQVSDNCDQEVAINETQQIKPGTCAEAYEVVRLWTATDNCGNTATASQTVKVEDRQAPAFSFVPPAVTLPCTATLPSTQPEATDNCDQSLTLTEARSTTAGSCPGNYTVTRVWTAVDNCGNSATASQVVKFEDKVAPTFANVPQATTISCADALPQTQPVVSDNCDKAVKTTEARQTLPGACPGSYAVLRVWTASDACGNTATASQTVTVVDDQAPVFTEVPVAVTIACTDATPTVLAKATDNCDKAVKVSVSEQHNPGQCAGAASIIRTFTATDHCGNTATTTQQVNIVDRVPPVFANVPVPITIECDAALPTTQPSATDLCDPKVSITESKTTEAGSCSDSYRVVRLWTATDACGNTATASQVVTVRDTKAPTFVKTPSELTLSCSDVLPTELAQATDNCDAQVSVTMQDRREDGACADSYTLIRTFTATDNCGNTATAIQRINIRDTQAPTFASVPAAVTISCSDAVPTTTAKATDNCNRQVSITERLERVAGTCADGYQLKRLFVATDNCGNTATASQVVTVKDTKAPVFAGVPASITLSCEAAMPTSAPTATDDCDKQVDVVETQRDEPGKCANAFTVVRIWTATDNCGNTATATQRVERTDKVAPVFSAVPTAVTVACDQPLPTDMPVAKDNCDPAPKVSEAQRNVPGTCVGSYQVIRTFTATDACGNTATASQIVSVEDKQSPVFAGVPADVSIWCNESLPTTAPTATDNCAKQVNITEKQEFLRSACAGNFRVVRMWTATDGCGNTSTATQLVTVSDRMAPVFASVPTAITINCAAPLPTTLPTATDDCDQNPHISETQQRLPGGCADSYTLVRTFTATDECGNKATASQVVTVTDADKPTLTQVPPGMVVACEEELPTDQPVASDKCDQDVTLTEARTIEPGACPAAYVLVRVWTATDNCGNTATASQRVEVGDRAEPTFTSVPAAVTIWCNEGLPTDQPTAVDNCDGNPSIVETSTREAGACANNYRIVRTWTATDACGNIASASQVVSVVDKTAPVFVSTPPAITISCEQALPTTQPRASDDCAETVTITERTDRQRGSCPNSYAVVRIWTATDNCGNSSTASQVVTVEDKNAPVFASVPPSVTITCDQVAPDAEPVATDNCDTQVKITRRERRVDGTCADSYTLIREWTAIDKCGNTATSSQVVTVIDPTAPVFTAVPPAVTVACSQGLPTSKPTAADNCDKQVDVVETQETLQGPCPDSYVVIRTWIASDNCGHTARATQEVTVIDQQAPRFAKVPASRTVNCDEDPGDAEPTATDDCDTEVAITMTETTAGQDCRTGVTLTRVWTATDNCGNTATVSQVIRFEDTERPKFGKVDRSLSVECDQPIPVIYPPVTDNCDRDIDVIYVDKQTAQSCGATITRTWVASDDCGNTASVTQLILVTDSQLPILSGVPSSTQISCGQALPVVEVTASDNCTANLTVSYEELETPGRCAGERIIKRFWSATDACGNLALGSQEVVISDSEAPQLQGVPVDVELACGAAVPKDLPTAIDACGGGAATVTENQRTEPGACASNYRVVRTFTAADKCGNQTTATQVVSFRDAVAPVFAQVPPATQLSCGTALPKTAPSATDGCDKAPRITLAEQTVPGNCAERYDIVRVWTATDNCGNTATVSQIISFTDDQAPVLAGLPKDVTLTCAQPVPVVSPTAKDACAGDVPVSLDEVRTDAGGGYTLLRTWTATDNCGNAATATQLVTVTAGGDPVFAYVPDDVTLSCGQSIPNAEPRATDPCGGDVLVTLSEKRKDSKCAGNYELVRTWTARNADGKSTTARQTITVSDDTAPVFTKVPSDLELNCGAAVPTDVAEATDDCSLQVRVKVDEKRESGQCGADSRVVRTFTATDDCGNKSTATQVITFRDREAPVFTFVPESEEFQCAVGQPKVLAQATDNCTPNVVVTFADVRPSPDCSQRLQRVWLATDQCGNTATAVQQILLSDTERPTLTNVPGNASLDITTGESVPTAATVLATDNCDERPEVSLSEERVPGAGCGYVLVRTWTAVDRCGNTARGTQRISVTDGANVSIEVAPYGDCAPREIDVRVVPEASGATYAWTSTAGSFSNVAGAATKFVPNGSGTYTLTVKVSGGGCNGSISKEIKIGGAPLQLGSNAPICTGGRLELTASAGAREYRWTGPNGFTSTERNPVLAAASAAASGTYRLTADFGSCQQSAELAVQVDRDLNVELTVPTQICSDAPFTLQVSGASSAVWTAPDGKTFTGATVTVPSGNFGSHRGEWQVLASSAEGCEAKRSFNLTVIRPPVLTASANNPVCAGSSIELLASGASSYTWTGPNGFTAQGAEVAITDVRAYPAGSYSFIVTGTNATGCASRDTVMVQVSEAGDVVATAPSLVCEGQQIQLVASGASSYLWSGPNNFSSIEATASVAAATPLLAGTYRLLAQTATGCRVTRSFEIRVVKELVTEVQLTAATCADGGSISFLASAEVRYDWADLTGANDPANRTGLAAGEYRLTARLNSCERSYVYKIVDNCGGSTCDLPEPTALTVTPADCGVNNGKASLEIVPVAAYRYTWTPNVSSTNVATDLAAGDYRIVVTKLADTTCRRDYRASIAQGETIAFTVDVTPVTCEAAGVATIRPAVPGDYTVTWSDLTASTTELSRSGLLAGNYEVMLSTAAGCTATQQITVSGSCGCEAKAGVIRAATVDVCLTGAATDIAAVEVRPGLVPSGFVTTWVLAEAGPGKIIGHNTTGQFSVNTVGSYSIHQLVYDPATLPATRLQAGATIAQLEAILVQGGGQLCGALTTYGARINTAACCTAPRLVGAVTTDATCGVADGRAEIQIANALVGDRFEWLPSSGLSSGDGRVRTGLSAGTYRVTVVRAGADSCRASLTLVIGANGINAGTLRTEAAACGQQNGQATFVDADAALTFIWSDGGVGAARTNLASGQYTVVISSANSSCRETAVVNIAAKPDFQVTSQVLRQPDCGQANGEVQLLVSGGSGQFSYSWGAGATRSNLAAGRLAVTVTDVLTQCAFDYTAVLTEVTPGEASIKVSDIALSCFGAADGRPVLDITYGPAFRLPPTVSIMDANGRAARNGELSAGAYCVFVRDAEGCLAASTCFAVTQPRALLANVTAQAAQCSTPGSISLNVSGGTAPYSYDWRHLPAADDPRDVSGLTAGKYSVIIRDANGCSLSLSDIEVRDGCDSNPPLVGTPDTLRLSVLVNSTNTLCRLRPVSMPLAGTTYQLAAGGSTGQSLYGSWQLRDSCFVYTAKSTVGTNVDVVDILVRNGADTARRVVIVDVRERVQPVDTILRRSVRQGFTDSVCLAAIDFDLGGPLTTIRNLCPNASGTGRAQVRINDGATCVNYTGLLPGLDSLCLELCSATRCDSLRLVVSVLAPKPATVDFTLQVSQSGSYCLDTTELSSPITEVFNFCVGDARGFVTFSLDELTKCVSWDAVQVGQARGCYVICNAFGCDTTFVNIDVTPVQGSRRPVAVDDGDMTTKNQPVTIDVLANDTLNGPLDQLMILRLPQRGNVFMSSDNSIRYTPEAEFCGRVDSFSYQIGNGIGFDTATVRIDIACDELIVFSGFSPNGDGINDEFRIVGIEDFPDNRLVIFNRWGNEVYNQANYDNSADRAFTGRWNGKVLPDGTYFYVLDLGAGKAMSGYIQILR